MAKRHYKISESDRERRRLQMQRINAACKTGRGRRSREDHERAMRLKKERQTSVSLASAPSHDQVIPSETIEDQERATIERLFAARTRKVSESTWETTRQWGH